MVVKYHQFSLKRYIVFFPCVVMRPRRVRQEQFPVRDDIKSEIETVFLHYVS